MYSQTWLYRILLLAIFLFLYCVGFAQIRWDGGGEDGQWSTAANWAGDMVPGTTDDVLLDNSELAGNYIVTLPAGTNAVTVQSLSISPSAGKTIEVILPNTNTIAPAFITTGSEYGLTIQEGGIFRNRSGASSGTTISITDSIRINNGGRYIHNTARSNVPIVSILSKMPGTETGIVEFDVPGGAGYLPSLNGRTFGTLVFSSAAAGGSKSYSSTGSQPVTIRGDLVLESGVSYSISFSNKITIRGNFIQHGGTFNIESQSNNTWLSIEKDFLQYNGLLTEDNSGFPVVELNGNAVQHILSAGAITNHVLLKINNPSGIILESPLILPYLLEMVNGKINTTSVNLLTMAAGSSIIADSLSNNSFISGPVKVEGLLANDHYLLPVGKDITMRWIALKNATGNFTVEFFKSNPQSVSQTYTTGVHHISGLEYWIIQADASPLPLASVELSFSDPNSGGVTDLSALRVAHFNGTGWDDAGNMAVTGTPGSRGSVTSSLLSTFNPAGYFTLASSSAANPLPVSFPALTNSSIASTIKGWQLLSVNPSVINTSATIKMITDAAGVMKMDIVNAQGQLIKTQFLNVHTGLNTIPINITGLATGIFWIRVTYNHQLKTLRFIKQ